MNGEEYPDLETMAYELSCLSRRMSIRNPERCELIYDSTVKALKAIAELQNLVILIDGP